MKHRRVVMMPRMHAASQVSYSVRRVRGSRVRVELESTGVSSFVSIRTADVVVIAVVGTSEHRGRRHTGVVVRRF